MDVFGRAMQSVAFLRDVALAAGHELGVFEALRAPMPLDQLAQRLGVAGRPRLGALLDVLAALGALERVADGWRVAAVPARPSVMRAGLGQLADVIRRDRPLPVSRGESGEDERRLHHHLASAGAAAAAEVAGLLGAASLLDLGAGAGAYSKAFLLAQPDAQATLVDAPEILALAADWLGPLAARARFVPGDAGQVDAGGGHGAALLANLLHLHPPDVCAQLCAAAARAVAPGGLVAIKDLRVDDDRSGPLEGLLFSLTMAVYTEGGTVYASAQLRRWLGEAGLVDITEHRLATAPDAIVVIGRRPAERGDSAIDAAAVDKVAAELDAALARTAAAAWADMVGRSAIRAEAAAGPPVLAFPSALRRFLAAAVALERREPAAAAHVRADQLVRHYTDAMPRQRVAQLAGTDEPGATLFHTGLDWHRLPRLSAGIDRLFAVLGEAGVPPRDALGAPTADAFRARSPTLAALYERSHYGGLMPLLYGAPADLAYAHARGAADRLDPVATIDRYLTAPIVHELAHFAPGRAAVAPPHLDECIAGWLGVHVHPPLAYPSADDHDALYAAPWLAQVGQALARAFGVASLVRAHAGVAGALPASFVAAANRHCWDDWKTRRTLHFLSDTFDPAPWVRLALEAAPLADDPAFDRQIVEDGLRAMCLETIQQAGSFRTHARLPDGPIAIDAAAGSIVAPGRRSLDPVVPRYWLPPAVAAALAARGSRSLRLELASLAAIPEAAAAICGGAPVEAAGFRLAATESEPSPSPDRVAAEARDGRKENDLGLALSRGSSRPATVD